MNSWYVSFEIKAEVSNLGMFVGYFCYLHQPHLGITASDIPNRSPI